MMRNSRCRSFSCAFSVGKRSGCADGSSTICAKITARAAASGRRAHHRCSVLGCPWRIDFSRADGLVDGLQRQGDFDEFLLVGHACFLVVGFEIVRLWSTR